MTHNLVHTNMNAAPMIAVSGFGRCGSSMLMQMLHAGGVPCLGRAPAFEGREPVQPGQAVKILDPQSPHPSPYPIPAAARVIWVDRDAEEQAASHAKFVKMMMGASYSRAGRRALVAALRRDRPAAMRVIGARPLLVLSFETLLARPDHSAERIAAFVGGDFNAAAAARQVRPRNPRCAAGLDMELSLMSEVA